MPPKFDKTQRHIYNMPSWKVTAVNRRRVAVYAARQLQPVTEKTKVDANEFLSKAQRWDVETALARGKVPEVYFCSICEQLMLTPIVFGPFEFEIFLADYRIDYNVAIHFVCATSFVLSFDHLSTQI